MDRDLQREGKMAAGEEATEGDRAVCGEPWRSSLGMSPRTGASTTPRASLVFFEYITNALRKLLEGDSTKNYRKPKIKRRR